MESDCCLHDIFDPNSYKSIWRLVFKRLSFSSMRICSSVNKIFNGLFFEEIFARLFEGIIVHIHEVTKREELADVVDGFNSKIACMISSSDSQNRFIRTKGMYMLEDHRRTLVLDNNFKI